MSTTDFLALIDAEIASLQQARALITGTPAKRKPGRPAGTGKKKRKLSPEGRARLVAAVKARWAAQKRAAKSFSLCVGCLTVQLAPALNEEGQLFELMTKPAPAPSAIFETYKVAWPTLETVTDCAGGR